MWLLGACHTRRRRPPEGGRVVGRPCWCLVSAVTVLACALGAGCTPDPGAGPTVSPAPTSPSATALPTPPETDIERQMRLDYEAAEKVYRRFRAEYRRVLRAGGAKQATTVMKETAGNGYLEETEAVVKAYKNFGDHQEGGRERIVYVRYRGWKAEQVTLAVCEDSRSIKALDKDGKSLGPGEFRTVTIRLRKFSAGWKLWSGSGKKAGSC